MAWFTEVSCSEAAEQGYAATELAFPVDLRSAVFLTRCSSSTNLFQQAVLAQQVLLLRLLLLCVCHLLLTIDQSTEVGLLATITLVEGAPVIGELLRSAEVRIGLRSQALIVQKTLLLSVVERLPLDLLFQADKRAELLRYGLGDTLELNLLLAAWAGHESEGDP